MTTASRLRFWLARLKKSPRYSELRAEALRWVDELAQKLRKEREARHGRYDNPMD